MITWAEYENIKIEFSRTPNVSIRYIAPYLTEKEEKDIRKKPFVNCDDMDIKVTEYGDTVKTYDFLIRKAYTWDGATIPRLFWRLIGSCSDNTFLIASLVHDVLCENKELVDYDRKLSSKIFKALLLAGGVGKFKAQVMYLAVDTFQKFQKGWFK